MDLTQLAVPFFGVIFSILGTVATTQINTRVKDAQAAATINNAVKNALGAMEQVAVGAVSAGPTIAGVAAGLSDGVRYVQQHAGPELLRFPSIDVAAIASKISAQVGLGRIAASKVAPVTQAPILPLQPRAPIVVAGP